MEEENNNRRNKMILLKTIRPLAIIGIVGGRGKIK
jgi:hypothetical protein